MVGGGWVMRLLACKLVNPRSGLVQGKEFAEYQIKNRVSMEK